MHQQLKGTGVALVTPFKQGEVDHDALARIIDHVIRGGVEYLVCLGTTGEASTITLDESHSILKTFIKVNDARVPIVLGALGGNDTAALIRRISEFDLDGVSAFLSASPAYNKPSQEGIYQHYLKLSDHSPLPILIYNVPGRTCSNITAETTLRIAEHCEQVIGIKDASADMMQVSKIAKHKPADFLLLSGDDPTTLSTIAYGGEGVISVIANAFPRQFSDMVRAALAGDYAVALQLHQELLDIHQWLYIEGNPTGIKAAMSILDLCGREMRLPLVPMTSERLRFLKDAMDQIGTKK